MFRDPLRQKKQSFFKLPQLEISEKPKTAAELAQPFPFHLWGPQRPPPLKEPPKVEEKKETPIIVKKPNEKKRKRIIEQMEKESAKVASALGAGGLVNFYNVINKKFLPNKPKYKNYDKIKLDLPIHATIAGATGSGKTNYLDNIINAVGFKRIILCAKNLKEPLYAALIDKYTKLGAKLGEKMIMTCNNVKDLPPLADVEEFMGKEPAICIMDDQVSEDLKAHRTAVDYFIRARKEGGGVSCFYLTQSYFKAPKSIRDQTQLIELGTINSQNDLKRIVKEYTLEVTPEQLMAMHNDIQKDGTMNFLTIDLSKTRKDQMHLKYRKNLEVKDSE